MSTQTNQSIFNILNDGEERSLIVAALQALHRERVNAWKTALRVADMAGTDAPSERLFGIAEPVRALERMGAGPYIG